MYAKRRERYAASPFLTDTCAVLRERKNGRKSDEKIAGTCGGHLRLALSVRAKMETAERAPGRTIDVGKPNESNRTRAFGEREGARGQSRRRREREIEAGRERRVSRLSEQQTKTLIELSEARAPETRWTSYDGRRPKATSEWLFIRTKMYTYTRDSRCVSVIKEWASPFNNS